MVGYELHQLLIAHGVGRALGNDGLFELGCFGKVVHELLLDRAAAGDVDLIRVHQMVVDLFEKLVNQGDFEVVRGTLVRVGARTWIFGMAEDGEHGSGWVIADDGRVVSVHPDSEPLFDFV